METVKDEISEDGQKVYKERQCSIEALIVLGMVDGDIIPFFVATKKDYKDSIVITNTMITETKKLMKEGKVVLQYPSGKISYRLEFEGISERLINEGREKLRKNTVLKDIVKEQKEEKKDGTS